MLTKHKTQLINYTITWEQISILICFKPNYFSALGVSHLEIKAAQPLPITSTGYKSIWISKGELQGIPVKQYVIRALNDTSKTKKRKDYLAQKQLDSLAKSQLVLF